MQVVALSLDHKNPAAKFVVIHEGRRITINFTWIGKPLEIPIAWERTLEAEIKNAKTERENIALGRWVP